MGGINSSVGGSKASVFISSLWFSLPNRSKIDDEFAFLEAMMVSDIDVIIKPMANNHVILDSAVAVPRPDIIPSPPPPPPRPRPPPSERCNSTMPTNAKASIK